MSELGSRMVCSGCGTPVDPAEPLPFRCPNAASSGPLGDTDHVLVRDLALESGLTFESGEERPFVRYRKLSHVYRRARRTGWSDAQFTTLVDDLDQGLDEVVGKGFHRTPYVAGVGLESELGLDRGAGGGLWIKDETGNVAGSHKSRHLAGVMLQLQLVGVPVDKRLAIASCGNAALAAAVLARATGRPLDAFVPPHADRRILATLESLGVNIVFCERSASDPPGDPCFLRYRAAVADGALPYTCQGSENGLVIEGGQTLGWELAEQHAALVAAGETGGLDRVLVQVGGGALGSALVAALRDMVALGILERMPRVHTVQPAGTQPLARAWRGVALQILGSSVDGATGADLAQRLSSEASPEAVESGLAHAATHRSQYMWPWEAVPSSLATGILDDETYDWRALVRAMIETGGWPLGASEEQLSRAHASGRAATGIDVCATGTAGLAGCYELAAAGVLTPRERIAVLFTGAER